MAEQAAVQDELGLIEVRVALERADRALIDGRLAAARAAVATAEGRIDALAGEVPAPWLAELERLAAEVAEREVAALRHGADDERYRRRAAQQAAREQRAMVLGYEGNVLEARLATVVDLKQREHYELALSHVRRMMGKYPEDERVRTLYAELLRLVHVQRRLDIDERMAELRAEVSVRLEQDLLPDALDGMPDFPADWHERRERRRGATGVTQVTAPAWEQALRDRLAQRIDVDFDEVDAGDALAMVAADLGSNIVVDGQLRAAGLPSVTLRVAGMRADHVVGWLARQMGSEWSLRNEAVWIGGDHVAAPVVDVYDVAQYLYEMPVQEGVRLGLSGSDGGDGFDLFGNDQGDTVEALTADDLVDLIQGAVAPEVWEVPDYGIGVRGDWLVVTAPARVHELIRLFLRSQYQANNVMVRINLRWLEIGDDFIEEIGVDWNDFGQNVLRQSLGMAGVPDVSHEWGYAASLDNRLPESAVNLGQGSIGGGLNLHYVHLALPAISAVLRDEERKRKVRQLHGVELSTVTGVRASTFFGRQMAYISDYEVATANSPEPIVSV
ncbi:MAG: hypothetical protein ACYTF0_08695, partial [Planctomycetota bacterium]